MHTFHQDLVRLLGDGLIAWEDARAAATDPHDLEVDVRRAGLLSLTMSGDRRALTLAPTSTGGCEAAARRARARSSWVVRELRVWIDLLRHKALRCGP